MKICPKCNTEFDPGKWNKTFCSRKCANSRNFTNESNKKRSVGNKQASARLTLEQKQVSLQKRLASLAELHKNKIKPLCIDCGKLIKKENKHKRCQPCYFKSDACSHALGHYRNYERLSVVDSLGNPVFLMSSLEIRYYNFLTKNGIQWKKPASITYKDNTGKAHWYKPDFEIINTGEIIEIKGYFWNNDKIKMAWVIEQNPAVSIKILTKKELDILGA